MNIQEIKSKDWALSIAGQGEVVQGLRDVSQCIYIIVTTAKGSDPLRPTFGADIRRYLDRPVGESVPQILREVSEAIELWETRVTLTRLSYKLEISSLFIRIEWTLANGLAGFTDVTLNITA